MTTPFNKFLLKTVSAFALGAIVATGAIVAPASFGFDAAWADEDGDGEGSDGGNGNAGGQGQGGQGAQSGQGNQGLRVKAKGDRERTPTELARRRVAHRTAQVADDRLGRLKVFQR